MKAYGSQDGRLHVVRLDRGEEVMQSLATFVAQHRLPGGSISGIGAVERTAIGFFDLHRREYVRRSFKDEMELLGLTGNLSWADGEPVVHAHVVLAGPDYRTVGGHLFQAFVAVTAEIVVTVLDVPLERGLDQATGLKLLR